MLSGDISTSCVSFQRIILRSASPDAKLTHLCLHHVIWGYATCEKRNTPQRVGAVSSSAAGLLLERAAAAVRTDSDVVVGVGGRGGDWIHHRDYFK